MLGIRMWAAWPQVRCCARHSAVFEGWPWATSKSVTGAWQGKEKQREMGRQVS